jgi:ABC-type multidrug transport system ATPase subunit
MYRQTSGAITIESGDGIEFDTRTNIDLLTIQEQLEFYASARGFAKNKRQIASEMLRVVNLDQVTIARSIGESFIGRPFASSHPVDLIRPTVDSYGIGYVL